MVKVLLIPQRYQWKGASPPCSLLVADLTPQPLILAAVVLVMLTSAGVPIAVDPKRCSGVDCDGGGVDGADGTTPPTTRFVCQSNGTVLMAVAEGTGGG